MGVLAGLLTAAAEVVVGGLQLVGAAILLDGQTVPVAGDRMSLQFTYEVL